ncbi:prolyl oligopeptidase family serine peptidase [Streptomyces sp. NBC_00237]|uniref:prolyl oligopeptidase family serine peptidase n=1 Tax=Streptomyces sp. NBC_00237 TaxID=2975687 RepID=UPI002252905E|nr:prolyl oligopeptidase family serine peptidase [Streptomyces sp. NBC_00237]MCX5205263.1 prolyl oligopeptidase family serine peptidase [Streptomyces sp. NBC_00237]
MGDPHGVVRGQQTGRHTHPVITEDPYLWLEDIEGPEALDWVRKRTTETEQALGTPGGGELAEGLRQVLDDSRRIPHVTRRGPHLYNFRRDADHVRGVWRRTTLDEYRTDEPTWEVLLDVDALAEAEDTDWVWAGAPVRYPDFRRALVRLSPSGTDAVVVREFDLETKEFVPDGFRVPEGKTRIGWIDDDTVYLGIDLGPGTGTLTDSGYPRTVRRWRRGTPVEQAELVYEVEAQDLSVSAWHDPTEGFARDFLHVQRDFWNADSHVRGPDGQWVRIEVPGDADAYAHRQWLVVEPKSEWLGQPAGSLLVFGFDAFLAGGREPVVLFSPTPQAALAGYSWTRDHLILETLTDVSTSMEVLTPVEGGGSWERQPLGAVPPLASAGVVATDEDSDEYFLETDGFLQPPTLHRGEAATGGSEVLKRAPALFDTEGLSVRQYFAVSDDGTRVPYFVTGPDHDEPAPTLLHGYGGFEHALLPGYSALHGRGWLARGGRYVLAGVRGGGEYGPDWHRAALKAERPRAFEDFAAVARDLVERGLTTPGRLGVEGRSNGGLLAGAMLARYPDLFGAVVIGWPLLDMLRYHRLLAGASWMAEYGDPDDPADRPHLADMSPYHGFREDRTYPPVLILTATSDDRVHPGHARKAAARLREQGHEVYFHETSGGGHAGANDNAQTAAVYALKYTFLWWTLTGGDGGE